MKKTRQQSVLTLFTAAVFLFGSSGGVAWGQIYQSQRNPDRAQLRGTITGGIDANASGHNWWNGTWSVTSSFTVENNYGPGETGTLTPQTGISTNTGVWTYGTTNVNQGFNVDGGIITVGGTNNHVGHMARKGTGVSALNYDSGHGLQGTSGTATATASLTETSGCSDNLSQTGYLAPNLPRNDGQNDNQTPGISTGSNPSFSRSYGITRVSVSAPTYASRPNLNY